MIICEGEEVPLPCTGIVGHHADVRVHKLQRTSRPVGPTSWSLLGLLANLAGGAGMTWMMLGWSWEVWHTVDETGHDSHIARALMSRSLVPKH